MTARIFLSHTADALTQYYGDGPLAALRRCGEVRLTETGRVLDDPASLAASAAGCAIIVADRQTPAPAALFDLTPELVAICRVAVDIRNIDVEAASRRGVLVTRATPGFVDAVAELAVGFMVDLARGVSAATGCYRAGQPQRIRRGRQLKGATLGIIGYGAIGARLAGLGLALGMRVLVHDPFKHVEEASIAQLPFEETLAAADFLVCLAVATEATENLMDAAAFAHMRSGAFFINLSRGNLVDEAALAAALGAGHLGGAALDVGRAPDQMPSPTLAARADVIATPHIGGLTPEATEHQAYDTVRQVAEILAGRVPMGAVNPAAGRRLTGHPD
jgi:D-3-phosphoglycerate dehydrogenase